MSGIKQLTPRRKARRTNFDEDPLIQCLEARVMGQEHAMRSIVPYVHMYESGLAPEGRPAGVFLLLGPTGTGKTRTVEALAETLHGSRRNMLRIDCGEYQMDHEVAKLIGAPPGYLGHRETHPVLTQARLAATTSQLSSLSIVLFDEVEKAAPSLTRLLLGVLDKASLRLGDNNVVNFERCLIFMTSNVGAQKMQRELNPGMGFRAERDVNVTEDMASRLDAVAISAAQRTFAPEFMNRIDSTITYHPLQPETLEAILDLQLSEFQDHLNTRLQTKAFKVEVTPRMKRFLLSKGVSPEYGAREIRRAVQKYVAQKIALLVVENRVKPGGSVRIDAPSDFGSSPLPKAA